MQVHAHVQQIGLPPQGINDILSSLFQTKAAPWISDSTKLSLLIFSSTNARGKKSSNPAPASGLRTCSAPLRPCSPPGCAQAKFGPPGGGLGPTRERWSKDQKPTKTPQLGTNCTSPDKISWDCSPASGEGGAKPRFPAIGTSVRCAGGLCWPKAMRSDRSHVLCTKRDHRNTRNWIGSCGGLDIPGGRAFSENCPPTGFHRRMQCP